MEGVGGTWGGYGGVMGWGMPGKAQHSKKIEIEIVLVVSGLHACIVRINLLEHNEQKIQPRGFKIGYGHWECGDHPPGQTSTWQTGFNYENHF